MQYKSYIVEEDIDVIKESLVLFYGENLGLQNDIKSLIKKRNKKSGDLVFSIELTTADNYMLEKSGRYSHSTKYISSLCDEFGFAVTNFKKLPIRKENKQNIPGALYRLRF